MTDTQPLQFKTCEINNEQIHNLLIMTPHFYRETKEGREAASKLQKLELTVDVVFRTLEKTGLGFKLAAEAKECIKVIIEPHKK